MIHRVGRPPDFPNPEHRKRLVAAANEAVERLGKAEVRTRLNAAQPTLDRWLRGEQGMSTEKARALAALVGRTLDDLLGIIPDRQSKTIGVPPHPSDSAALSAASRTGVDVGLAALHERAESGHVFSNLALFLHVNDLRRAERRREWKLSTIIAAAGGIAGDEDYPPEEWESILDAIEEFGDRMRRGSGTTPSAAKRLTK